MPSSIGSPPRLLRYPEVAAAAAIVAAAAALRLLGLTAVPLSPAEAVRALAAWQLVHGAPPEWWDAPGLVIGLAAAFLALGDGDGAARLLPALAGIASLAGLWLFRPWLRLWPLLGAMLMAALSPTGVTLARTVSEDTLGVLMTLLLGWFLIRFWERPRPAATGIAMAGVALLLHLGYAGFTGALALAAFGFSWSMLRPQALDGVPRWLAPRTAALLPFVGTLALLATGGLLHLPGFGLPSLRAWALRFENPELVNGSAFPAWLAAAGYDLPALMLGLPAAAVAVWSWHRAPLDTGRAARGFMAVWALLGLVFWALSGRSDPSTLGVAVLPLALLAGAVLGGALERVTRASLLVVIPSHAVLAILIVIAAQFLARGTLSPERSWETWLSLLAALLAGGVVAATVLAAARRREMLALLALPLVAVLMLHSLARLHHAWPDAPLPQRSGIQTVSDLVRLAPYTAAGRSMQVTVDADLRDGMAWYVRRAPSVAYLARPRPGPDALLLSRAPDGAEFAGYRLRSVALYERRTAAGWGWRESIRWLLFDEVPREGTRGIRAILLTSPSPAA